MQPPILLSPYITTLNLNLMALNNYKLRKDFNARIAISISSFVLK